MQKETEPIGITLLERRKEILALQPFIAMVGDHDDPEKQLFLQCVEYLLRHAMSNEGLRAIVDRCVQQNDFTELCLAMAREEQVSLKAQRRTPELSNAIAFLDGSIDGIDERKHKTGSNPLTNLDTLAFEEQSDWWDAFLESGMTVDELFTFLQGREEHPSDEVYIRHLIDESHATVGRISLDLLGGNDEIVEE